MPFLSHNNCHRRPCQRPSSNHTIVLNLSRHWSPGPDPDRHPHVWTFSFEKNVTMFTTTWFYSTRRFSCTRSNQDRRRIWEIHRKKIIAQILTTKYQSLIRKLNVFTFLSFVVPLLFFHVLHETHWGDYDFCSNRKQQKIPRRWFTHKLTCPVCVNGSRWFDWLRLPLFFCLSHIVANQPSRRLMEWYARHKNTHLTQHQEPMGASNCQRIFQIDPMGW